MSHYSVGPNPMHAANMQLSHYGGINHGKSN
jgi:hypothetical protein